MEERDVRGGLQLLELLIEILLSLRQLTQPVEHLPHFPLLGRLVLRLLGLPLGLVVVLIIAKLKLLNLLLESLAR